MKEMSMALDGKPRKKQTKADKRAAAGHTRFSDQKPTCSCAFHGCICENEVTQSGNPCDDCLGAEHTFAPFD
jgi:hypothetical protein